MTKQNHATQTETNKKVRQKPKPEKIIPGQDSILVNHNESIMSAGEVSEPYHYVTFLQALGEMADTQSEWNVQ